MSDDQVHMQLNKLYDHFVAKTHCSHVMAFYINNQVNYALLIPFMGFKRINSHTGMHQRLIHFTLLSKKDFQKKFPTKDVISKIKWKDVVSYSRS